MAKGLVSGDWSIASGDTAARLRAERADNIVATLPDCLNVQKDWESLLRLRQRALRHGREEEYGGKNEKLELMLNDILKNNLSMEDLRHLAATCGMLPIREKVQSDFTRSVLRFMVTTFTEEQGQRQSAESPIHAMP